jgi:hypothetical protein
MSVKEFSDSNQVFAVNLVTGLLFWVFSYVFFIPLTVLYVPDWAMLVGVLMVIDVSYYLYKARMHSGPIFGYVSEKIAAVVLSWRKEAEHDPVGILRIVSSVLSGFIGLILYLMYWPLLAAVSPVLVTMSFIVLLIHVIGQIVLTMKEFPFKKEA